MNEENDKLINIGRAAEMLGISAGTLRLWDKQDKLKPVRAFGKHRRYKMSEIKKLIDGGK